jgi:predicted negative regulator of RcsB-dependent stress response
MSELIRMVGANGLWLMIIAVVAIGSWFKYREHELKVQQQLRMRELEHQQKMKELEIELEKAKQTGNKG